MAVDEALKRRERGLTASNQGEKDRSRLLDLRRHLKVCSRVLMEDHQKSQALTTSLQASFVTLAEQTTLAEGPEYSGYQLYLVEWGVLYRRQTGP